MVTPVARPPVNDSSAVTQIEMEGKTSHVNNIPTESVSPSLPLFPTGTPNEQVFSSVQELLLALNDAVQKLIQNILDKYDSTLFKDKLHWICRTCIGAFANEQQEVIIQQTRCVAHVADLLLDCYENNDINLPVIKNNFCYQLATYMKLVKCTLSEKKSNSRKLINQNF